MEKSNFSYYNRFGEIFYILHKNNRKFLNDSLSEYNLNLVQAMCLLMIKEKTNITQQDLTDHLFLTKSAITKAIRNLEIDKYIVRTTSPIDGRQYILQLTKKGENIIPVLNEINRKWEDTLGLNELDEEFIETIYALAEKSVKLNEKTQFDGSS